MFRPAHVSLLVVGSLLALSACNESPTDTNPPDQFVWEARGILSNGTVANLSFSADAFLVAVGGIVDTGIRVSGAEIGTEYGWLIRAGACGSNGNLLTSDPSAFPFVTIADNGIGAVAKSGLGFLEGTEQFHVEVYLDPRFEFNLVGCGAMDRVEGLPNF